MVMKRDLAHAFNNEIERYKNALLEYAGTCDWDTFKAWAGKLFDYVESVERSELERRFFRTFSVILGVLIADVLVIVTLGPELPPDLSGLRYGIIIAAVAGAFFEFYFFLGFKMYKGNKIAWYRQRRERFIRDIERDFKMRVAE